MNLTKKYLLIYFALTIVLIPFSINKYLEIREYSGVINETLEGILIVLFFQLFEALFFLGIIKLLETLSKKDFELKYVLTILVIIQLIILSFVI